MSGFPPRPGTVAFRVLAHLESLLPGRPRATAGMVAGELPGCTPQQVRDALEDAHVHGYVNREAEFPYGTRGPVFYELVRTTTGELASGAQAREQERESARMLRGSGNPEHEPRGVIEPVVDPNPEPAAPPALQGHAGAEPVGKVVSIRPMPDGGFETELERIPELSAWLHGDRGAAALPLEQVNTTAPVEEAAPVTVALDFAPGPDQFVVALASDGRIHCWRGSVPFIFTRAEARTLIEYLNRVDLDPVLEGDL